MTTDAEALPVIEEVWVRPGDWKALIDVIEAQTDLTATGGENVISAHSQSGEVWRYRCGHTLDPDVGADAPAHWYVPHATFCPHCLPITAGPGDEQIDLETACFVLRLCVETELAWRDREIARLTEQRGSAT